ncbi:hypothetical protein VCRA2113O415_90121 [Vibrio crassostreae]|nr:hypothetical protein VCRA2113O415_90121 [Vibrio crassostreae]CAK3030109.1 hypothetical protein VCRA2113O420_90120 [Vibrio crassostreae]CAK3637918.1 hypothetical protein VCRA2121O436_90120 [Vibrio crassostreae]
MALKLAKLLYVTIRLEVQQKSASEWQKNPNRIYLSPLDLVYR